MRKRVINHVADTTFWYILYFLPVLAYLMFVISAPFRDITKAEGFTASVEYREQWYYNLPVGYPVTNANSTLLDITDRYSPMTVQKNYTVDGVSTYYRCPVIVVDNNYETLLYNSGDIPFLRLTFTSLTDSLYRLAEPCKIPVPYSDFFGKTSFYITYNNAGANVNRFAIMPGNTAYQAFYSVEYVATELAQGMTYDFKDFVNSMGFEFATDNIIVNSLADIFGTGGIMPMFDNDTPFIIFAWFIGVYLLHLLVDFLLFIPRIAHKWMKDCTGGD